jgi:hypothetical protein
MRADMSMADKFLVDTEEEARGLVSAAGVIVGTGWPTERGKEESRRRYRPIPKLTG